MRRRRSQAAAAAAGDLFRVEGAELAALGRELRAVDPESYERVVRVTAGLLGKALTAERLRDHEEHEDLVASVRASAEPSPAKRRRPRAVN